MKIFVYFDNNGLIRVKWRFRKRHWQSNNKEYIPTMTLKNKTTVAVTENTFVVKRGRQTLVYKEQVNEKNKVIDCDLRDLDGNSVDDPAILEEVQDFVDNLSWRINKT